MGLLVGIILYKSLFIMTPQISYRGNKNPIKKKLSFFEGGHQLEKSISLRKRIVELGGNVEEPGT